MIRQQAIRNFADHVVRTNQWKMDPSQVEDSFLQFYYGYLFNKNIQPLIGLAVTVRGDDYNLGAFSADLSLEELHRPRGDFRLKVTAYAPHDGEVQQTPHDLFMRLTDGTELLIKFDQSNVAKKEPKEPAEGEDNAKPRRSEMRGTRTVEDEVTDHDRGAMNTVSMIASSKLIDHIAGDSRVRKSIPEIAYRLGCTARIHAAVKVLNTHFVGDNGEDILVKFLLSGQTTGAFSADYGTVKEWMNSIQGKSRHSEFEYTDEEQEVFDEYFKLLRELV